MMFVRILSEQQEQHYDKYCKSYYSTDTKCSAGYEGTDLIEAEAYDISEYILEENCEPEPFS